VEPIVHELPATLKIEFTYPQIADAFCVSPGSKRLDARTVSYTADNYLAAYTGSIAVLGNVLYKYDS
ncbi:MAG: M55 family metallopeptidase, partial [Victivallales bacterium]|nr:M55 family metallopeptidase [Victivallales bacterium]